MTNISAAAAATAAYADPAENIVRRFLPMVRKLAWHLQGSAGPEIELDDLLQAGLVALTECARRGGGGDADGFAAYAKIRAKGAMIDVLRRSAPASRGAAQRRRTLRAARDRLRSRLGREPGRAELAAELGLTLAACDALLAAAEPLRFEPLDDSACEADPAFRDPAPDSLEALVAQEGRGLLIQAIGTLAPRLRLVIQLYFVEELNLSEIAAVIGVSVPRVHQLKDMALRQLREELMAHGFHAAA